MKVYVDKEDKDFLDACLSECRVYEYVADELQYRDRLKLQSLTDYTKQVRKEAIKEILELIESDAVKYLDFDADAYALDYEELKYILNQKILDQIQGGDNA